MPDAECASVRHSTIMSVANAIYTSILVRVRTWKNALAGGLAALQSRPPFGSSSEDMAILLGKVMEKLWAKCPDRPLDRGLYQAAQGNSSWTLRRLYYSLGQGDGQIGSESNYNNPRNRG